MYIQRDLHVNHHDSAKNKKKRAGMSVPRRGKEEQEEKEKERGKRGLNGGGGGGGQEEGRKMMGENRRRWRGCKTLSEMQHRDVEHECGKWHVYQCCALDASALWRLAPEPGKRKEKGTGRGGERWGKITGWRGSLLEHI